MCTKIGANQNSHAPPFCANQNENDDNDDDDGGLMFSFTNTNKHSRVRREKLVKQENPLSKRVKTDSKKKLSASGIWTYTDDQTKDLLATLQDEL